MKIQSVLRACAISLVVALSLGSCTETIDTAKEAQSANEKAFLAYSGKKEYERITLPGNFADRYVFMKWENKATDRSQRTKATDYVRIKYVGRMLRGGYEFDRLDAASTNLLPQESVSSYVSGFSIALQNMVVGDKAEVIIPWYLAYGMSGTRTIPPYSALAFDIELLEVSNSIN